MTIAAWPESCGYLAAGLWLATFFMRRMVALRAFAIASSIAWLTYGSADHIFPVMAVHIVLLPLNSLRLYQAINDRPGLAVADGETPGRTPAVASAGIAALAVSPVSKPGA